MTKILIHPLILFLAIFPMLSSALELNKHPELKSIANKLVADGVYTAAELEKIFANVELRSSVVKAFKRPAEKLTWGKYRGLFINDKVIRNGAKFWEDHQELLSRATKEYGVPEEIIVAILGVETRFGTNKGNNVVINSLSTLSLQYERRKEFFQSELESFLKLAKSEQLDPHITVGSYAGAMGIPQFIASSYQAYAIDFDGDGKRDLINSYADAIGSVANYFKKHGWQLGDPVKAKVTEIDSQQFDSFKQAGKSAQFNLAEILKSGVAIEGDFPGQLAADIIKLDGRQGTQYQVVFDNFYVIKRYNHSNLYAMAVAELSQAIRNKYRS